MPTYTLRAPNGKTYSIEGPEGASEAAVRAEILRRDPSAGKANTPADMAKGLAAGALQGVSQMADAAGQVGRGMMAGPLKAGLAIAGATTGRDTRGAIQAIEGASASSPVGRLERDRQASALDYQPITTAGKYTKVGGTMLPNALAPGGMVRRAAAVVLPTVASEGAGQAVEAMGGGQVAQGAARFGGAVVGAAAAGARLGSTAGPKGGPQEVANILLARAKPDAAAMQAKAAQMRAAGIEPNLLDVSGDRGRRLVRAVGTKYEMAGEALATNARKVSSSAKPAIMARTQKVGPMVGRTKDQLVEALFKARDEGATANYREAYATPVTMNPNIIRALSDEPGKAALRRARAAAVARMDDGRVQEIDSILKADAPLDMSQEARMARANEQGFTVPAFHETTAQAAEGIAKDGFSLAPRRAATGDYQMPVGVFTKPTGASIGIGKDTEVQMPLLGRDGTTLSVWDRAQLQSNLEIDPAYAAQVRKLKDVNGAFDKQVEALWRQQDQLPRNSEASNAIDDQVEKIISTWKSEEGRAGEVARQLATEHLRRQGVKSVNVAKDVGAWGKETASRVWLDPTDLRSRFDQFAPEGYQPPPEQVSAATLHRARIAMRERATTAQQRNAGDLASGLNMRGDMIDKALEAVPQMAPANADYRAKSQALNVLGEGKGEGRSDLFSTDPKDYGTWLEGLAPEARDANKVAIRQEILDTLGGQRSSTFGSVDELATSEYAKANLASALGDEAKPYLAFLEAKLEQVRNARMVDPNAGSRTAVLENDLAGVVKSAADTVGKAGRGDWVGVGIDWLRSRGMKAPEAERLVNMALDPAQLDHVIRFISARYGPQQAQRFKALRQGALVPALAGMSAAQGASGQTAQQQQP